MDHDSGRLIKIAVVIENPATCLGTRIILKAHPGIALVAELNGGNAVEVLARERPDVVLIDLDLTSIDVLNLICSIQRASEKSLTLVLSSLNDEDILRKAFCMGVAGVVLKIQPPAVLIAAIESLCRDESYQDERQRVHHLPALMDSSRSVKRIEHDRVEISGLTLREREIIRLIGKGLKNKAIADQLCISETTVRHHLTNIFSKLGVPDRQQLLIWAHRNHFVELMTQYTQVG
jgi:DNA-binding NarL/FixJ family response regulator